MTAASQRHQALEAANRTRLEIAQLRNQIRLSTAGQARRLAAQAVLDASSPIRFRQLIKAVPNIGEVNAGWMLTVADISPEERVNSPYVGQRRRLVLAGMLTGDDRAER